MKDTRLIFWLPRVSCILVIAFTSLFALDVFGEGYDLLDTVVALFFHLLPQIIILIALLLAWKRPRIGGVLFILLSIASLVFYGKPIFSPAHLIMTAPILLIGILFLIDSWQVQENKQVR
jgi:hypothetical protein